RSPSGARRVPAVVRPVAVRAVPRTVAPVGRADVAVVGARGPRGCERAPRRAAVASVVAILAGVEHAVAAERDLVGADVAGGALRPGDAALIRRRAVHGIAVIDRRAAGEEPARSGRAPVVRERSKQ